MSQLMDFLAMRHAEFQERGLRNIGLGSVGSGSVVGLLRTDREAGERLPMW